jgi:hypothetical protein
MRPIFISLLLVWLWRLVILTVLLWRISRLPLNLVATHPDRAGGLGFLEEFPLIFSPIIFALSAVLASRFAHDALYHGIDVETFAMPVVLYVSTMMVLTLGPLVPFIGQLRHLKQRSLREYGALVGQHGRLVQRRWISKEAIPDAPLLQSAESGADREA